MVWCLRRRANQRKTNNMQIIPKINTIDLITLWFSSFRTLSGILRLVRTDAMHITSVQMTCVVCTSTANVHNAFHKLQLTSRYLFLID